MNNIKFGALSALFALGMVSAPAMANDLALPNTVGAPVEAVGTINVAVFGGTPTACIVTMTGTVTSVSPGVVTFTSGTSTGGTACTTSGSGSVTYPIVARATMVDEITIDRLKLTKGIFSCTANNVKLPYSNAPDYEATVPSTTAGLCTISGSLKTQNNPVVIAP